MIVVLLVVALDKLLAPPAPIFVVAEINGGDWISSTNFIGYRLGNSITYSVWTEINSDDTGVAAKIIG